MGVGDWKTITQSHFSVLPTTPALMLRFYQPTTTSEQSQWPSIQSKMSHYILLQVLLLPLSHAASRARILSSFSMADFHHVQLHCILKHYWSAESCPGAVGGDAETSDISVLGPWWAKPTWRVLIFGQNCCPSHCSLDSNAEAREIPRLLP